MNSNNEYIITWKLALAAIDVERAYGLFSGPNYSPVTNGSLTWLERFTVKMIHPYCIKL